MTAELIIGNINYIGAAFLFVIGLYTVLTHPNLIKKLIGLNIMETSVFLLFVSIGYVQGGYPPIISNGQSEVIYVNPLPSALILNGCHGPHIPGRNSHVHNWQKIRSVSLAFAKMGKF